jgi:hypothetical protein
MVVGQAKVLVNNHSSDGDESAYLALGLDLREIGTLTDGTRPPLYPLLLAAVAERDWAYFTQAKLISLWLGALGVVVVFLAGRGLLSWESGLLAAFLLAANKEYHLRASTIYADTLLVTTFLGAWYFLIKSFDRRRDLYLAGFFTGLAYLTKGSAPLLLGAWGVTALLHYRRQIVKHFELLIVPIIFFLTVSPLLIYNARVFGSPFYNFATTHVMWMDRWSESQVEDPAHLPTLSTYVQTHTAADVADRLAEGVRKITPVLSRTLLPSRSWEPDWLGWLFWGAVAAVLSWFLLFERAALRRYYDDRRLIIQFSLLLLIAFYFFSVWYAAVLIESRFLLPILGPIYLLLADVVVCIGKGIWYKAHALSQTGRQAYRLVAMAALSVIFVWAGWWSIKTMQIERWSLGVDAFASDLAANADEELVLKDLLQLEPAAPVRIIFGPSKSLPLWKFPRRFQVDEIPVNLDSWPKLAADLREAPPDYIIIDSDTARRRRQALRDYFSYDEDADRVDIKQIPADWALARLYGDTAYRWTIFEPFAEPPRPLSANLADQVLLTGYQSAFSNESGQPRLRVTLYWRDLAAMTTDYNIFLHLTAPDGFVKAQQDGQPFDGLWPTSRWQVGDQLATTFEIELAESIQPGQYLLLTGLYQPGTNERLPLLAGPAGPAPNSILLDELTIE